MQLTRVAIGNYKSLKDAECPLSAFVCAVGENNAGKSSLLQALLLFVNGTKLSKAEFYDPTQDIVITVSLNGLTEEVLAKLTDEHRLKLIPYVKNASIDLVRRYSPEDCTSKLRVVTQVPNDPKYDDQQIDNTFKGKKGKDISDALVAAYPETTDEISAASITTQKAAKDIIQTYIAQLPIDQLVTKDIPLPTGIDNSIRSILPEPVYIPAVKDLSDELKTRESATSRAKRGRRGV